MNTIIKFGFAAFAPGAFSALPSKADTPDATFAFTKHGLPLPGAYSKARENQQAATIAVSKTGAGVGQTKQTTSKAQKKQTKKSFSDCSSIERTLENHQGTINLLESIEQKHEKPENPRVHPGQPYDRNPSVSREITMTQVRGPKRV